jgi:REG-2-like HAD superfamily hydrolase
VTIDASIRAFSFDAAGTLLVPRVPIAATYHDHARRHGARRSAAEIAAALPEAMRSLRSLRAEDRGWRAYWSAVIARATACEVAMLVDELYGYYADPSAWRLAEGTLTTLERLRAHGFPIAVISNWDDRLRDTLDGLGVLARIDALLVSAEVGVEKPDPRIFTIACAELGVVPHELVHIGDDDEDDLAGARSAGCAALHVDRDLGGLAGLLARLPR